MGDLYLNRLISLALIWELLSLLNGSESSADPVCPIELSPDRVVIKYEDSVSVSCINTTIAENIFWTADSQYINDTTWSVKKMLEWDITLNCTAIFEGIGKCSKPLHITVYKAPDNVSISILNHSGPLVEGTEYHLQCDIQNVAPLRKLVVKWYKGNEFLVNVTHSNHTIKTPVDVSPTFTITPSRDDEGAQYRCEAELDLGPEGPQPPPTVSSEPLNVTVHYPPTFLSSEAEILDVRAGENIFLNCIATGRPTPHYSWVSSLHIQNNQNHTALFTPSSELPGNYTCIAAQWECSAEWWPGHSPPYDYTVPAKYQLLGGASLGCLWDRQLHPF